jgi:chromosome segregation ATPase
MSDRDMNDQIVVPSMKLDKDDVRSGQAKPQRSAIKRSAPGAKTLQATKLDADGSPRTSKLSLVSLALAVIIAGVSSYFFYQQSLRNQALEAQLADLSLSLQSLTVSNAALAEEAEVAHEFASSEIRKLWGVAYDRNRSAIASNTTAIARLETSLASTSSQVQQAARSAGESGSAVERLQTELANKDVLVNEANQRALLLGEVIQEQQASMQQLSDRIADLERQNALANTELSRRIEQSEALAAGFDAYRQTVNRQLNELRNQLPAGQ